MFMLVGACWLIVKYLIFPRLPEEQKVPEHEEILEEKLDRLTALREELECAKEEKEVTEETKRLDGEIEDLIKEIKRIENA